MWEVRVSPCGDFDNHARAYRHIKVEPLAAAMGAEVVGVRLPDLSDDAFAEFKDALWRHKMLFLRDQQLSHGEHAAFSARLGPFAVDAYTQGLPGHRDVHPIIKEASSNTKAVFGGGWHTDSAFLAKPPSVTILRAVEVPPFGGDTAWANCALAFRMLSETYRQMLRPLKVHMSAANNYATQEKLLGKALSFADQAQYEAGITGHFHPLVRVHPETGEESLYVDEIYAAGIEGMTTFEAKPILDYLIQHVTHQAFTCRLRWEPGMIAMWDNRSALHLGPNDYDGYRREMYRTTVEGEVPA
jgi:taurine dioxygenase